MSKILLVEDDPGIIDVYTMALKEAGIETEVINLGKDAVEKVKKIQEGKAEKPALVLLDLILDDMNGIEVLKEIRLSEATKDIKVFITSNYASPDLNADGGLKPDKFILKTNITPSQLAETVKSEIGK